MIFGQKSHYFGSPRSKQETKLRLIFKYDLFFQNVIRFWVGEMGIDGFRMDAVPFIFEDPEFKDEPLSNQSDDPNDYNYLNHTYTFNLPEHYDMLGQFNDVISEFELIDGNDR